MCRNCWESLEPWQGPVCPRCGIPFATDVALDSSSALCPQCRKEEFDFDAARAYGVYAGKIRAAILRMKFQGRERLGLKLGGLLAASWDWVAKNSEGELPVLVPVPLHSSRQRERGFNQAELLAWGLGRELEKRPNHHPLQLETDAVRRTRVTLPQTGLSLRQRHENVRGVFDVVAPERLAGRVAVLVDDVMTTGATVSACAAALKRAGVRKVLALTLARATPQFPDDVSPAAREAVDDSARAR
ncbi:MAG: ComF family protein [Acidobacteria bacterium]|nr:ComF family protein [Acidobacteriota bacterium]